MSRDVEPDLFFAAKVVRDAGGSVELPLDGAHAGVPSLRSDADRPAWIDVRSDGSLQGQGFRLAITEDGDRPVLIEHATPQGLRDGLATLRQLIRLHGRRLATRTYAWDGAKNTQTRGVMLDVSRDRIPTMAELFSIVETLAELGCNHLQLYTEHTFAYPGHEAVWSGWSPITPEELRRLDAWCRLHCIDLCANQNCFGHLSGWLRTPGYEDLAETHDDYDFYGLVRKGPFSLCPTDPRSLDLAREWLDVIVPLCSGPIVNIGCDETADVGTGRSKDAVRERGPAGVYYDYVNRVAEHVHRLGKKPMLWADIAAAHPDAITRFPPGSIAAVWGYEPDTPFEEQIDLLREIGDSRGVEIWTCPGTSSWRSFTGRTAERRANMQASQPIRMIDGHLTCDWGDVGHRQVWPISMRGLADGLSSASDPLRLPTARAVSIHALGDPTGEAAGWLDELGDADYGLRTRSNLKNATALFSSLHPARPEHAELGNIADWSNIRDRLTDLRGRVPATRPFLADELRHAADCALLAADVALARLEGRRLAADRVHDVIDDHRRLWRARSRPGGLANSCAHYERLLEERPFAS
ncbi:MAG: hypothetical protein AAF138_08570 [Planctomycetota bacterium]